MEVLNEARFACATDFKVLLTGESGVSKGWLAQFIHDNSPRREPKMLSWNCARVAQSRLETELFGHVRGSTPVATACYEQITQGPGTFWTVVYGPFRARKLTRETVRAVITRGLRQTNGSYEALPTLFNLPPTDYTRLLHFLLQHNCHPRLQAPRAATDYAGRVTPAPQRKAV